MAKGYLAPEDSFLGRLLHLHPLKNNLLLPYQVHAEETGFFDIPLGHNPFILLLSVILKIFIAWTSALACF